MKMGKPYDSTDEEGRCKKEDCAWYMEETTGSGERAKECAVKVIAENLNKG